jgi:hypothetical protein
MAEDVLETEAIEVSADGEPAAAEEATVRPLPATVEESPEVTVWTPEVKTAALAAAGGIVAGAATVAVVRAAGRTASPRRRGRRGLRRDQNIVASRSFLVDVHLLGSK